MDLTFLRTQKNPDHWLAGLLGFSYITMGNYNSISTAVNPDDTPALPVKFERLHASALTKSPYSSKRIDKEISKRRKEIFPLGLGPFSSANDVAKKTSEILRDIDNLVETNKEPIEKVWSSLCQKIGSKARLPAKKKIKKTLKRLLFKVVDKSGFIYQSIIGLSNSDKYISDDYYNQLKSKNGFYSEYLYSISQNKKKHGQACSYLTRACGISSLAQKDGLPPYCLTITLDSRFHRSSPEWDGSTPPQSKSLFTDATGDLYQSLRNNKVRCEYIWMIEPDESGTPHFQATVFTDDPVKFRELVERAFNDITDPGPHGIYFEETDNAYRNILYTLKTAWPGDERMEAWKRQVGGRCFGTASLARSLPTKGLFDAFRKDKYNAKNELEAIDRFNSKLKMTYIDEHGGETSICLAGDYYVDIDDAITDTHSKLRVSALEGDYANFTRIFNATTRDLIPRRHTKQGLDTAGSLGSREIKAITELRTIRQVIDLFDDKIRDIEDNNWLLRNKWIGKKSPEKIKAEKERDKFLKGFADYMNSFKQMELFDQNDLPVYSGS